MEKTFVVKGMTCVICKKNVEKALQSIDGVNSALVNLLENEVTINYDESKTSINNLEKVVKDAGYVLITSNKKSFDFDLLKLTLSILLIIVLMIISMNNMNNLSKNIIIIELILSTIIILLNFRYYNSGFKALVRLNPNMDSLIFVSSFTSYIYSIYASFKIINNINNYHLFFETAAMILVIVSIGKKIENSTKAKAVKVIRGLATLIPMQANLLRNGIITVVPINEIKKNDIVLVKPGESIPQDGVIVKGTSTIDESMITGESIPVEKNENDEVIGGTINTSGTLEIQITKSSNTTVLANIINLTKKATMEKIPIERFADSVSKYFVFVVFIIAILTYIIWFLVSKDNELSINFALSVLVISCPCALGLATPAAISVSVGKAAKNGILIKRPEILEITPKTKKIIFDKTGTLTKNELSIIEIKEFDNEFINVVSSIEKNSNHPIAKAIVKKYGKGSINFDSNEYLASLGVVAKLNNDIYKVGNLSLIDGINEKDIEYANENRYSLIAATKNDRILGIIYLSDIIRPTSKNAIKNLLKRDIKPVMCTGDNPVVSKKIADLLNIEEYYSGSKPEDKNNLINKEKEYGIVMMVGDGVNDAIALANADISITIKNASDIASASSDVVLMKNDLNDISFLYDLSIKTMNIIKQNLFWALAYNSICIPVAAGLFYKSFNIKLSPIIGSVTMLISSLFVLLNALRINTIKKEEINLMNKTIFIEGMMCERCKKHIEDALKVLGAEFEVSLEDKKAFIKNTSIDDETLTKAIEDAGYDVKEIAHE